VQITVPERHDLHMIGRRGSDPATSSSAGMCLARLPDELTELGRARWLAHRV